MPATTYLVTLGSRVIRVEVRREAERVLVRVNDGPEQTVSLSTARGPLRSFQLGEARAELLADRDPGGVSLAMGGLELRAEVVDEVHARLASLAGGRAVGHARRELKAPMPGLLVAVLCQPGERVEAGQPLAVLQAMKMENELSLSVGGTVVSVGAEPGQTIEQGQVLVVVE